MKTKNKRSNEKKLYIKGKASKSLEINTFKNEHDYIIRINTQGKIYFKLTMLKYYNKIKI